MLPARLFDTISITTGRSGRVPPGRPVAPRGATTVCSVSAQRPVFRAERPPAPRPAPDWRQRPSRSTAKTGVSDGPGRTGASPAMLPQPQPATPTVGPSPGTKRTMRTLGNGALPYSRRACRRQPPLRQRGRRERPGAKASSAVPAAFHSGAVTQTHLSFRPSRSVENRTMSISELQRAIREGRCSAGELLHRARDRIAAEDENLRAWVCLDDRAAECARELDRLAAEGRFAGPLHGIPVGVKDVIDVAGLPTAAGSEYRGGVPAVTDAQVVRRLRAAGAVIVGKTVTTQFACFDPAPTRNPLALDRTPGGSSSGSAAAVAAGHVPLALATQTGGSITRPASYCGVCGYKPTFGAVSVAGCFPVAPSLDHVGLIAASVADLCLAAACIVEPLPEEPSAHTWLRERLQAVSAEHWWANGQGPSGGISVAPQRLCFALVDEPLAAHCAPETLAAVRETCERLRAAGVDVGRARVPDEFKDAWSVHRCLMAAEAAAVHEADFRARPEEYLPNVRSLIEEGLRITATRYVAARRRQAVLRERVVQTAFASADVLICAATPGPPPDRSTTGSPACNSPWSLLGLPTVSLPVTRFADGLPACVQLVARPYRDAELLAAGAALQDMLFDDLVRPTAW
ncbi:MAG: amidase [Planctomycetota bacterium]|nr:MAG: amidase [Planctomycetota bacterium]